MNNEYRRNYVQFMFLGHETISLIGKVKKLVHVSQLWYIPIPKEIENCLRFNCLRCYNALESNLNCSAVWYTNKCCTSFLYKKQNWGFYVDALLKLDIA